MNKIFFPWKIDRVEIWGNHQETELSDIQIAADTSPSNFNGFIMQKF